MDRLALRVLGAALVLAATSCAGADDAATDDAVPTSAAPTTAAPTSTADPTSRAAPPSTAAPTTTIPDVRALPVDRDGEPVPPATAAEAVARIVAVEDALRSGDAEIAGLGHHHQVLYRTVNRNPDWLPEVLGAVDDPTAVRISTILDAGNSSATTVGRPLESIPAWTIRTPRPPDELLGHYQAAEAATGVPWSVLAAINLVETRVGRIQGESSAGAQGPMQFLPSTWALHGQGGQITDDGDAIAAAARLLAATGAPGDLAGALFAYNRSDRYVASVLSYHDAMQADPWLYAGLHGWQVYVSTVDGLRWLEEGFSTPEPVPLTPAGGAAAGSAG